MAQPATIVAIGLDDRESSALVALMPWLKERSGAATQLKATTSALLSVKPKATFVRPACMAPAARELLRRYVAAHDQLSAPGAVQIIIDDSLTDELPMDVFTGETLSGGQELLYAITAEGPQESIASTSGSWLYHMCLNGAVHPANRAPITGFGRVSVFGAAADGAAADGAAGSGFYTMPADLMGPLRASLATPDVPPDAAQDQAPIALGSLMAFEDRYGVPPERQLSRQLVPAGGGAGGALGGGGPLAGNAVPAQLGPNGLGVIAELFGPQAAAQLAMEGAVAAAAQQAVAHLQALGLPPEAADDDALMDDIVGAAMEDAVGDAGLNLLGGIGLAMGAVGAGGAAHGV